MDLVRIVISFKTKEEAENNLDIVHQMFSRRNPLEEPDIHIEILNNKTWLDTRIQKEKN